MPKAVGLNQSIHKQSDSQQSHFFNCPLGITRHGCHLSRAAFVGRIAAIMGLHVASRAGVLVVRHSWGHRPVSHGSYTGLGRRAWLWVAGVEGHLWRTPLEHRLSHLMVTVGVLGCSRGFGLKLRDGVLEKTFIIERALSPQHGSFVSSCL